MDGAIKMTPFPFLYPLLPHVRKHGPQGYKDYGSFKDWLRDEFSFRCVYCLKRERWGTISGNWDIDHFLPQDANPDDALNYENLLYSCRSCNGAKGNRLVPNPCEVGFGSALQIQSDGTVKPLNAPGRRLVKVIGLNDPDYVEFRGLLMATLPVLAQHKPDVFERWMAYPSDLPDLRRLRPTINSRPAGKENCFFVQRERGVLPATY